jgi:hypothetical protein
MKLLKELENNIQKYLDEDERNRMWLVRQLKSNGIEVSIVMIHSYCSNARQPKFSMMCEIAKVFGVKDVRKLYKEEK